MGRPRRNENVASLFGEKLKERRVELGLSQKNLAEALKMHPNNIIEIEKGRRGLTIDSLVRYCKALKLRVELVALGDETISLRYKVEGLKK